MKMVFTMVYQDLPWFTCLHNTMVYYAFTMVYFHLGHKLTHKETHTRTHTRTHARTHTHTHAHTQFVYIWKTGQFSILLRNRSDCHGLLYFSGFTETCHIPNIFTCEVIVYLQLFNRETLLDSRIIHVRTFLPPPVHVSSINPTGCATMEC